MFWDQEVLAYIEEKLCATWSPEQISRTPCELKIPSWRTIYRWIYEKYLVNGNLKVLRRKGKTHGVKETRGNPIKCALLANIKHIYGAVLNQINKDLAQFGFN